MKKGFLLLALMTSLGVSAQKQWTLDDCINYAMQHNIDLQQVRLTQKSATEDVKQSKAALLPTLSASTNQSVNYDPWDEFSTDKVSYNGTYTINAQWTVWNGGQNTNQLKLNKLREKDSNLTVLESSNSVQEAIAKLYVQILYQKEAIEVNRQSLETSKKNEERGQQMVEVGQMSKADLAQLTAQRASSEYNVVEAETQLSNYKLQLKRLLQLTGVMEFDIASTAASDNQALTEVPALQEVYETALLQRPEIQSAQLGIESSKLQLKIAKAGWMPSVNMTGNVGTSTFTSSSNSWGKQMKTNFGTSAGVGITLPLFDGRKTKTNVQKALIAQEQAQLTLKNEQYNLFETIEGYWLNAINNQQKFRSAVASVDSEQESYDLLQEQFNLGMKNIVELLAGKDKLLQAQQNKLQSKYLTILNLQLLKFYEGETMKL
jgi:outer membrane protein